jgi:hypothetical protein
MWGSYGTSSETDFQGANIADENNQAHLCDQGEILKIVVEALLRNRKRPSLTYYKIDNLEANN